jgi:CheY-like chemotaxis protein
MAKIVLVDREGPRRTALSKALRLVGHEVVVAGSGSLALTALEREPTDLVVAGATTDDMTGADLCSIMRDDPQMQAPMLLLADGQIAKAAASAGVANVLPPDTELPEILDAVEAILSGEEFTPAVPDTPADVEAPSEAEPRARTFSGSLAVMDMAEVTQAIGNAGKTGLLKLSLGADSGVVWFTSGRAVHAEFRGLKGEAAFRALVVASHEESNGDFCFDPVGRSEAAAFPTSIARSVDQLLLIVAADIDESRPAATPRAHATARAPKDRD